MFSKLLEKSKEIDFNIHTNLIACVMLKLSVKYTTKLLLYTLRVYEALSCGACAPAMPTKIYL